MRRARPFVLLLLAIVLFDIASPLSPGAFQFAPEKSIEVAHNGAARAIGSAVPAGRPEAFGPPARPSALADRLALAGRPAVARESDRRPKWVPVRLPAAEPASPLAPDH